MDLLPYTNYSVRVAAYNNLVGEAAVGPYSEEVYVMTMAAGKGCERSGPQIGREI